MLRKEVIKLSSTSCDPVRSSTCVACHCRQISFLQPRVTSTANHGTKDLRNPGIVPLNFTRSINLAVSERGINAMRHAGQPGLLEHVMNATIPMRGRMIHGRTPLGELYEHPQDYDAKGRVTLLPEPRDVTTQH